VNEAVEVDGSAIVASCEAPEMLEAAKASFDLITVLSLIGLGPGLAARIAISVNGIWGPLHNDV